MHADAHILGRDAKKNVSTLSLCRLPPPFVPSQRSRALAFLGHIGDPSIMDVYACKVGGEYRVRDDDRRLVMMMMMIFCVDEVRCSHDE